MESNPVNGYNFTQTRYEVIEEGPVSTVSRTRLVSNGGLDFRWAAIKAASTQFSKEPHDIIKEFRILSGISHTNVINILGDVFLKNKSLRFWMPYVPHSLSDLLTSPSFSPRPLRGGVSAPQEAQFSLLAKSVMYQIVSAVAYLHDRRIAHRDIKPNNVLLTEGACVKLIDFGISWKEDEDESMKKGDLWPEYPGKMYFEVSTGPYRAPELLFGTRSYDALAIDLWSLGVTFAEFFTTLRLYGIDDDHTFDSKSNRDQPFVFSETVGDPEARWFRDPLFNAERGEIGLAWSIFKTLGTPTDETWPAFGDLPDASAVTFHNVPPVDLSLLLPNLPTSVEQKVAQVPRHHPEAKETPFPLDLLQRFLVYPPSQRLQAARALSHPWFTANPPVLLPSEYRSASVDQVVLQSYPAAAWKEKELGEWFKATLFASCSLVEMY